MTRSVLRALFLLVPVAVLCGGCLAVGQSFALASVAVSLLASGAGSVAIAVLDRREWIKTGAKPPFFAGNLRGGFGNPFDVVVKQRQPLADAMSQVAARGLKAKGFKASAITIEHTVEDDVARQRLAAAGADRQILIHIHSWQADTYTNVAMYYLLTVAVMDSAGNVLAQHKITGAEDGKDNLRGSVMNPAGYAKKAVPKAFAGHIEELLNNEDVVKALS
jgi:hypothetical protein